MDNPLANAPSIGHELSTFCPKVRDKETGADVHIGIFCRCSCGWVSGEFAAATDYAVNECRAALAGIEHAIEAVTVVMPDKFKVKFKGFQL